MEPLKPGGDVGPGLDQIPAGRRRRLRPHRRPHLAAGDRRTTAHRTHGAHHRGRVVRAGVDGVGVGHHDRRGSGDEPRRVTTTTYDPAATDCSPLQRVVGLAMARDIEVDDPAEFMWMGCCTLDGDIKLHLYKHGRREPRLPDGSRAPWSRRSRTRPAGFSPSYSECHGEGAGALGLRVTVRFLRSALTHALLGRVPVDRLPPTR
jgi:hypothetical protein